MNRILITQPITPFNRIIHMPPPIVFRHVPQRGVDTTLRGDRVRTRRKQLGDARGLQARLGETKGSTQTSTAGTDDNGIELVVDDWVALVLPEIGSFLGPVRR